MPLRATTRTRRLRGAWALLAVIPLLASCSADDGSDNAEPADGGEIVIGAEQEPDCADWIGVCGGAIWGLHMMQATTIPAAFDTRQVDGEWGPSPSDVLAGEPTVEETAAGGQTITYSIDPDAVWSDGTPISSADFRYTALQMRDDSDIVDRTGYTAITDVEMPDEQTAVVQLSEVNAGWRGMFSGSTGILPAHILEGGDRGEIMDDGYDFSGGPWIIESWDRGVSVTLVPNDNYWGEAPLLDKVTFQFITDTTAAFQALQSGQVDALFPSPQLDAIAQIEQGIPGVDIEVADDTGNLEAIWMNNAAPLLSSPAVRQALAYGIDRQALNKRVYGPLGVTEPAQSFLTPLLGAWGADDFSRYELDVDRVDELMEGDGWQRGNDDVWEQGGDRATLTLHTIAGNARRDLMVQVIQSQLADAGFEVSIVAITPAELFSSVAPQGDFDMGLWTLVDTFPEPTLSSSFSTNAIPTESNGFSGINFVRASNPDADALFDVIDTSIDEDTRIAASVELDGIIADDVFSLPVAAVPSVLMRSDEFAGDMIINPAEGPFWNLQTWGKADG